ncbi:MAG: hypothetical protein B6D65_02885 [candidate division Zixibacteria bacterium 4484_93]|nr:MAG: hypothetical protein B6D65_02885 [candidate division Zixibacteria bacterium 4484_93]
MRDILPICLILILLLVSCGGTGETIIDLPPEIEDKDLLLKPGYGLITIRYVPPPPPVFAVVNYSEAIDFDKIQRDIGIPDKPCIVEYLVDVAVMSAYISQRSGNAKFDTYVLNAIRTWGYDNCGRGLMRVKIDVPKRKATVDASSIKLNPQEPGRPEPTIGSTRSLVKINGFSIVAGTI